MLPCVACWGDDATAAAVEAEDCACCSGTGRTRDCDSPRPALRVPPLLAVVAPSVAALLSARLKEATTPDGPRYCDRDRCGGLLACATTGGEEAGAL